MYICLSLLYHLFIAKNTVNLHVELKITQLMDFSLIDGYRMHLTCMASISNKYLTSYVDMTWSGMGLQQSLWVEQSGSKKEEGYIERKLLFEPWLDLHAGEYTCKLVIKDKGKMNDDFVVDKPFVVTGKL